MKKKKTLSRNNVNLKQESTAKIHLACQIFKTSYFKHVGFRCNTLGRLQTSKTALFVLNSPLELELAFVSKQKRCGLSPHCKPTYLNPHFPFLQKLRKRFFFCRCLFVVFFSQQFEIYKWSVQWCFRFCGGIRTCNALLFSPTLYK